MEGLESVATGLRGRVGRALRLRIAPHITFRQDESIARASRIETLLAGLQAGARRRCRRRRTAARPKEPTTAAEGLLLVDKPAGVSSHDVVAVARRALAESESGTPARSIRSRPDCSCSCIGRATRLVRYVRATSRRYTTPIVRFGAETDTEDPDGASCAKPRCRPARDRGGRARASPARSSRCRPPIPPSTSTASARTTLARAGRAVALAPVTVTVHVRAGRVRGRRTGVARAACACRAPAAPTCARWPATSRAPRRAPRT